MGAGTSIQAAAILDERRRSGPGTETRDHGEKSKGKIFSYYEQPFSVNLKILYRTK